MLRDKIITGEFYHIYNRGVEKREIFSCTSDYGRFVSSLREFNTNSPAWLVADELSRGRTSTGEPLVNIIAYCLNPNHYHLILEQKVENGITLFMRKLGTGYTMYFNKKYARSGFLFQGKFKSIHIASNEYLLYVSAYVNCNSEIHGIAKVQDYIWCSFPDYVGKRSGTLLERNAVMQQFRNVKDYEDFAMKNMMVMKNKKEMQKLALE